MRFFVFLKFIAILFSCLSFQLNAQDSKKLVNVSSEMGDFGFYLFPNFGLECSKHTIAIGPVLNVYPYYKFFNELEGVQYPTKSKYWGLHVFYQYSFLPESRFDPFLQTNLSWAKYKLYDYRDIVINQINIQGYEQIHESISQTLGVGVKANLTEFLFVNMSVNFGLNYYYTITENLCCPKIENKNFTPTAFFSIGVGYRF